MGLRIATNVMSLAANRQMTLNKSSMDRTLERLITGNRINHAGDDAAGLAISESLRSEIRSNRQARRNTQDGISVIQVAEGGLNEISNILIRLRELAIQASSDTVGDKERQFANNEFQTLKMEIDRIANASEFNEVPLLNGKIETFEIQVGTHNNPLLDRISYYGENTNATLEALQLEKESIITKKSAQSSIASVDEALAQVNTIRANIGAMQNRLQSTIQNLAVMEENLSAANSRIRDADLAEEISEMTKLNVLMQSGVSVLAQVNNMNTHALKLLS